MKVSLITTVYNEQDSIVSFLKSIFAQSKLPDELIIVDGGSTDNTLGEISNFKPKTSKTSSISIKVISKKGNRSVGRNEAIKHAKNEIILISDAGNILDRRWVENITKPFNEREVDVVAGFYKGLAKNIFQRCLIPYVLVMPDKANVAEEFLPATRSMAIKKSVWKKNGGFNEKLAHNEDFAFANKLKEKKVKMVFAKDAIVNWIPRTNLKKAFIMFFRFALGDIEAGIIRSKVLLIFTRYFLFIYLLWLAIAYKSLMLLLGIVIASVSYLIWSVLKNYRYVKDLRAIIILPIIQIAADASVMLGSIFGVILKILKVNYLQLFLRNKTILTILLLYSIFVLSGITWGLPNDTRPFTYHMDEWHFLGALKSVVKTGSAGTAGGAYGPIFYSTISALFLIPFTVLGIINPFAVRSSVTELMMQRHIFEILRLTTLIYGILSIVFIYKILKEFFTKNWIIGVLIFTLNPLFLLWSGYYKHEIAVTFWITLAVYVFLRYANKPNYRNLIFSAVVVSLAVATKLNAAPLIGIFFLSFFMFTKNVTKKWKKLTIGTLAMVAVFLILGSPDILFNFDTYIKLLKPVLFTGGADYYNLGLLWWQILLYVHYPSIMGIFTNLIFYLSFVFFLILIVFKLLIKQLIGYKQIIFILISFMFFCLSLLIGGFSANNSHILVLLPFMAIMVTVFFDKFYLNLRVRNILLIIFIVGFIFQFLQSASWAYLKYQAPIQEESSKWIIKNIPYSTLIGIENIPIYQGLPDVILMEFYSFQHDPMGKYYFKYEVIDINTVILPNAVVITGGDLDARYVKSSPKKDLVKRLDKEGYKIVKSFTLDYKFFNYFSNRFNLSWSLVPGPSQISIYTKR